MFCPLIDDNCNFECMFCNQKDYSCELLKNIEKIKSNTGSDQTESNSINSKLETIIEKLNCIIEKIG